MCISLFLSRGLLTLIPQLSHLWTSTFDLLTDQMVFPKINHGFLSADQQLIKRRLIKVVLLPAGVCVLLRVQVLSWAQLLCFYLLCMAHRGRGCLCKYLRIGLCLVTYSIESPPGLVLFFKSRELQSQSAVDMFPKLSGSTKLYTYYAMEPEPILLYLWFCEQIYFQTKNATTHWSG